ncbi:hypothetical protein [Streptomyces chryseus]
MTTSAITVKTETTVRRLVFIRLLHEQGIRQSEQPRPLSATAILSFHDAVEHFLCLSVEHLKIMDMPIFTPFEHYWKKVKVKENRCRAGTPWAASTS